MKLKIEGGEKREKKIGEIKFWVLNPKFITCQVFHKKIEINF